MARGPRKREARVAYATLLIRNRTNAYEQFVFTAVVVDFHPHKCPLSLPRPFPAPPPANHLTKIFAVHIVSTFAEVKMNPDRSSGSLENVSKLVPPGDTFQC